MSDQPARGWFFTSDLHGQSSLYEQVLAVTTTLAPDAVIIGGDLCPHHAGVEGLRLQRVFLQGFLVEFARRLREASPATRLLLLMGNDDWADNSDCLEAHHSELWFSLHGRATEIGGVRVAGLSWVPITPFGMKDWERWDDGLDETPGRLEGTISRGGELLPHTFDPAARRPTIAAALDELATLSPPGQTLLVSHSPARDTRCDLTAGRNHVGSRALRSYVERHQPPLVLSGHIHESPRISGTWRDLIGATTVVNPGQFGTPGLCGVWFDPLQPHDTLRHTVHGQVPWPPG